MFSNKWQIVNFLVILAIIFDILVPKSVTAGSFVPYYLSEDNESKKEETVDETNLKARLPSARDRQPRRVIYVTVTAYSSTPDQCDSTPFITASGEFVRDGIIASNFLPFGTKVRFPEHFGNKIFTVEDRMHPRYSNRVDIWMPTREQAKKFGIKRLKMEIY